MAGSDLLIGMFLMAFRRLSPSFPSYVVCLFHHFVYATAYFAGGFLLPRAKVVVLLTK